MSNIDKVKPIPGVETTEKLADYEADKARKHEEELATAQEAIENILSDNNVTIGEWYEMVKSIGSHHDEVIVHMNIKEIKQRYERPI